MQEKNGRAHLAARMLAVGRGDRLALRDVYDLTSAKLFGICMRILGNREEAEDVLQDVYLTVWNKAVGYEPERASPITWLATIARNRAIDRLRAIGSRPRVADLDEANDVRGNDTDALSQIIEGEGLRDLHRCLDELEERASQAIRSAFFTGRTYEDLAGEAGMPLGTMKSVIRRGLLRLRGCLES